MLHQLYQLRFASDATVLGLWSAGFAVLALAALYGDRRRTRRTRIDQVGWVPWTGVFFASLLFSASLFLLALSGWKQG